jgi:subtilisin family serine protease
MCYNLTASRETMHDSLSSNRTQVFLAISLVLLMLGTVLGNLVSNLEYDIQVSSDISKNENILLQDSIENNVVFLPDLDFYVRNGEELVELVIITNDLDSLTNWQIENGFLTIQSQLENGQKFSEHSLPDFGLQHRKIILPGWIVGKLGTINGIVMVMLDPGNPEPIALGQPDEFSVASGELHGATDSWDRNISGQGIKVAVADSGIDFAHPDLNGTQARVNDTSSPWNGWPIVFDPRSMDQWQRNSNTYPDDSSSWYADTSTIEMDLDGDGILDESNLSILGLNPSVSGEYHLGLHPDTVLQSLAGGEIDVLVIDELISGEYDVVYVDTNRDGNFSDEVPMRKGSETAGRDTDGDGLWDQSAGMVYWISDGANSLPYAPTFTSRAGLQDRIPGNGNLTLFMLNVHTGPAGNHGTLCASAVAAQGVVGNGAVLGMAPDSELIAIANIYAGGSLLDVFRFAAEGYDGNLTSGDESQIASFSFGWRPPEGGADGTALYLDWMTRVHATKTTYLAAAGNGGHGYGTVATPGASSGIITVGAFSSKGGDNWGQSVMWTDRGPNALGRMDPDIVAVGWSATGDTTLNQKNNANSAYSTWAGTSLATPVAAGLTALATQAWYEKHGDWPNSLEIRNLIMSTADDRGYDPFVQGAGWFNAKRAVETLLSENESTFWVEPAYWMAGELHGDNRDANMNILLPGQSDSINLTLNNTGTSSIDYSFNPSVIEPITHERIIWNASSSNGWDGYQSSRPDVVIPVNLENNLNITLDSETILIRARATLNGSAFDSDQNRNEENRPTIKILRWNDNDGDGNYWEDIDGDGQVDDGEWESGSEYTMVTETGHVSPQTEARMGMPLDHSDSGILVGVWLDEVRTSSVDPVQMEIDITTFGYSSNSWIQHIPDVNVLSGDEETVTVNLNVPLDAYPGLHQQALIITANNGTNTSHSWPLPIIVNVAMQGPSELFSLPLDDVVENQTLYRSTWMQGAQGWGWREESGDWKSISLDWPSNLSTGNILIDVDWDDNVWTDIDAHLLSEQAHPYFVEDPLAYGPVHFSVESGSANDYQGSGKWNWNTYTGGSHELLQADASNGVKQLLLHSTFHGVGTNDNPVNVTVSYVDSLGAPLQRVVDDWKYGGFNQPIQIGSTHALDVQEVRAIGWIQPLNLLNESATQDTPGDWSSSGYIRQIDIENAQEFKVEIDSNMFGDDLDLAVYRDSNENGIIDWGSEQEASSGSGTSRESVLIESPADGNWFIVVQGYDVPTVNTTFWMNVEILKGEDLVVEDVLQLNKSQIIQSYPNGSSRLGGIIPEDVITLNLTADIPPDEGYWKGILELVLEGDSGIVEIPYHYQLNEWPTEIEFLQIQNGESRNKSRPVSLHMLDRGGGFLLSDLDFNGTIISANGSNHSEWELNQWHDFTFEGIGVDGEWMDLTNTWLGLQVEDTNTSVLTEYSGFVVFEAEDFSNTTIGTGAALNTYWSEESSISGYSGSGYLEAKPNNGVNTFDTTEGPRLDYEIDFNTPGTYTVYVRMSGQNGNDDSLHAGLDGNPLTYGDVGLSSGSNWEWEDTVAGNMVTFDVQTPGRHTFNIWMREDGTLVDKVVLQQSGATPTGLGPSGSMSTNGFNSGLMAEFFDNSGLSVNTSGMPDLSGRTPDFTRIDSIVNYSNSNSQPWPGLSSSFADEFSSRHTGYVRIDIAGNYTFFVNSDDGSKFWIDNQVVVENIGTHSIREESATIYLAAGYHSLRLEFFENFGWAGLELKWESDTFGKQYVPAGSLFHGAGVPIRQGDIVSWWPLDEANGTVIGDVVGNYNLSLNGNNGTDWDMCRKAFCNHFDGVDDYAEYDLLANEEWSGDFTVSLWVKADMLGQSDFSSIFAIDNSGGQKRSFQFMVDGANPGTYQLYSDTRYDIGPVDNTSWVHLAATLSGSNINGVPTGPSTLRVYYNGLLANTASIDASDLNNFNLYKLGVNRAGNSYFAGLIDDVRVYDVPLGSTEILAIYNNDQFPNSGGIIREAWLNFSQDPIEGTHFFEANILDVHGLTNSTTAWLIHDHTNPTIIPLNLPYSNLTNLTAIDVELELSEFSSLTVNEVNVPSNLSAIIHLDLSIEGNNHFIVKARDAAGNWGELPLIINRDTMLPAISLFPFPQTPQNVSEITVTGWVEHSSTACLGELVFSVPIIGDVLADCDLRSNQTNSDLQGWRFSVTYDASEIEDGEIVFNLNARDWAGNWNEVNQSFYLDTRPPSIEWLSPLSSGENLSDQYFTLSWNINEEATQYISHNNNLISEIEGSGTHILDLELVKTGLHEFCIFAIDLAQNIVEDCINVNLSPDIYLTDVYAPWDGKRINNAEVSAEISAGPNQTFSWAKLIGNNWIDQQQEEAVNGVKTVIFNLDEGDNNLRVYISTLDGYVIHELSVNLDREVPVLNADISLKNITVSTEILEITGDCEPGLNVNAILQFDFSEVECSEIGRYALTLPLSGEDGNKIILLSSEDLAGNKIEIPLEIVLDTISPTVSLQQINGSCSEKPIPTIFDNNNQPLCVLGAIAKYSGDDIVEWSIVAYYEGIEYDRKEGVFIENGKEITLEISDTSNLGSWTFTAWVVDEAGNFYEISESLNLTSEDYTGLQHATKIGSSLNLIIIVLVIFILFTLVLIRKRENIVIETFEGSLLINPDMMFEGDDLSLKELETENTIPESELIDSEELYNSNENIDELVIEQNHETSADIESIQELLDSNIDTIEMAESFANDTGIMLAAEGTIQGQSGWYHDRQGDLAYWNVNETGEWTRIDTEMN